MNLVWAQANTDGVLVDQGGYLHYARLVGVATGSAEFVAVLRDGLVATAPAVMCLNVVAGRPDDWPVTPVALRFLHGLYVTFVGGTAPTRFLAAGWTDEP